MLFHALAAAITVGTVLIGSVHQEPQTQPADRTSILTLAREGRAGDAWKAWETLPPGKERLRIGITLSVRTHQVARGLDL